MVEKNKTDEEINKKNKKKNIVNETVKKDNDFAKVYLKSIKISPRIPISLTIFGLAYLICAILLSGLGISE